MSYIDVTGKTEDEAISRALAQLGMDRDDVSVEILERAKSGFLGIGSAPAKVRVTYGQEEEPEVPAVVSAVPPPSEKKPVSGGTERVPAPEKPQKPLAVKQEKASKARQESTPPPVEEEKRPAPAGEQEEINDEKAQAIREFLSGLLEKLEVEAKIHVYLPEKGRYQVILEGSGMGQIIGRRGETLDAIQQLTSYSVNRTGGGRVRIQLDAENYRAKREQSLVHLAKKVAGKVTKYRRNVTLEPMNAYERHIIHTALQEVPNVTTYSTGMEPNRRVVVAYDRDKR